MFIFEKNPATSPLQPSSLSFIETLTHVVRQAEVIATQSSNGSLEAVDAIFRVSVRPLILISAGFKLRMHGFMLWVLLGTGFIVVISLAVKFGLLATYPAGALSIAQLLPAVLVIFALPSSYALSGVTASEIRQMRAAFEHFHVRRGAHLDSLLKATASVAERCKSRVLLLKVGLGGLWAFFMYLFSKLESTQLIEAAQRREQFSDLLVLAVAILISGALIWSYEAATEKVFRLIEFAGAEVNAEDAAKPPAPGAAGAQLPEHAPPATSASVRTSPGLRGALPTLSKEPVRQPRAGRIG